MDRPIVLVGELPCAEDFLFGQKAALYGFGMMASAAIGPNTGVAGLAIAPTSPASLSFTIGSGSIYEPETVDATAYGVLGTDTNTIIKQGILAAPVTLTVTPPSTSGFSQVYIVQVGYSDVDNGSALVPFFNSADPSHPSSSTQNTIRQGALIVQLKAGTAAATGSQTTPSPDPGFTATWAITVANGATTVTSANWQQLSANNSPYGAPWFPNLESLNSLFQQTISVNTTFFVNNAIGSDTTGNGSVQFPWASIAHAIKVISAFNLGTNTVTIQLALTGVPYSGPGPTSGTGPFAAPSNGTLVIQGDPAAQGSYVIQGTPSTSGAGSGVIMPNAGTVSLIGLTVKNLATVSGTACVWCQCPVSFTNVTLSTSGGTPTANLLVGGQGSATWNAGNIFTGNGQSAIFCQNGGGFGMFANGTVTGSPTYSTAFIVCEETGGFAVSVTGLIWSGAATGARYLASMLGYIQTGGAPLTSFFPGTIAGSTNTGGQIA